MTDAEHYQQQLEQQEQERDILQEIKNNHSKFIAATYLIRDSKQDPNFVNHAIKYLLEALEDYENLRRMM
jgi:hypothetical protein